MNAFEFWRRWLFVASIFLVFQGVAWIFMGSFDPWGIYEHRLAKTLFGAEALTPSVRLSFRYGVALLGATDAAFFVLFAFIVRYPFAKRERWSHLAMTCGLLTWFLLDSAFSLYIGAAFNVVWINIPCLLLLGIPLGCTVPAFYFSRKASADE